MRKESKERAAEKLRAKCVHVPGVVLTESQFDVAFALTATVRGSPSMALSAA